MLDITTIKMNCAMLSGDRSKYLPKDGINIQVAIIMNELKTAITSNLFLKIPTFTAGYIVDLLAKAWYNSNILITKKVAVCACKRLPFLK